ncbi:MAG: sulfotransferase family protein [Burkholderiales bacterium]
MTASPIFVFSAGWRSGSTLLQRLITASSEALIWGESGGALNQFVDADERYRQMLGPGNRRFAHGFGGNGSEAFQRFVERREDGPQQWIACLNPLLESIRDCFKKMLEDVYASPAETLGYRRWGVKEVQCGLNTARFLRDLFPHAKFVFLVRDPKACLLSIKRHNWMDRPPGLNALAYYSKHWLKLASEFRSADFGKLLRYEDLITDSGQYQSLMEYLEIVDIPAFDFINKSRIDWQTANQKNLSWLENIYIGSALNQEMKHFGYA